MAVTEPEIWDDRLLSVSRWQNMRAGKAPEAGTPDFARYLSEKHHRFYGRPWCIGRTYFDFLVRSGLKTDESVLDFGCGAGRLGIWLIGYLNAGNYVGVDHHWEAIDAFCRYEIPLHGLTGKAPRIILDGSLEVPRLERRFDMILDCFVSRHFDDAHRRKLYEGFAASLSEHGRILSPHKPYISNEDLNALGLKIVHSEKDESSFLKGHFPDERAVDHWHVISAA